MRGKRKNVFSTELVSYASPLNQAISILMALLVAHAIGTMILLIMTISTDVVYEDNFLASKSAHVLLPLFGAFYAALAYQKSFMVQARKIDYLNFRLLLVLAIAFTLLIVDCVFFGKDAVPTIRDCYDDTIPRSVYCITDNMRLAYSASVGIRAGHIILDALIIISALSVRYATDGDSLVQTTTEEFMESK